jgi:LysM repeat protein
MTDRGLPIVDGAPACPFVAFEDDRDTRATGPDHRHRCFAEVRPAPRALAHQEAYCLSSAFPVCPTFQDWARREAAQARAGGPPNSSHDRDDEPPVRGAHPDQGDGELGSVHRNPHRDWAAPPPWVAGTHDEDADEEPEIQAQPPVRGGGLAGSFADRLASDAPSRPSATPPAARWEEDDADADEDVEDQDEGEARQRAASGLPPAGRGRSPGATSPSRDRRAGRDGRHPASTRVPGPPWERPRRMEAYPSLKTRLGLPALSLPPILVGVAAVLIAAVALFFLPTLLGVGNPPNGGASPSPTISPSAEVSGTPAPPTAAPGPTQQVYIVVLGDTMSKIAARFDIPLQVLVDANAASIPDPDVLVPGQELVIPNLAPSALPDAGQVTEAPSTAP